MAKREAVAILGGTGDQGLGLAYRFAQAKRTLRIGSRKEERALTAAEEVRGRFAEADVVGLENAEAVRAVACLLYTTPSPRDLSTSGMPCSA